MRPDAVSRTRRTEKWDSDAKVGTPYPAVLESGGTQKSACRFGSKRQARTQANPRIHGPLLPCSGERFFSFTACLLVSRGHQVLHQGHEPGLVLFAVGEELQSIALLLDQPSDGHVAGHRRLQIKNVSLRAFQIYLALTGVDSVQELLNIRFRTKSHGKHILSVQKFGLLAGVYPRYHGHPSLSMAELDNVF